MIIIGEILVGKPVVKQHFQCDLSKCKGACCWEGDFGAPLEKNEVEKLTNPEQAITDKMEPVSLAYIEKHGAVANFKENKTIGANILPNGRCVFLSKDKDGIDKCVIEQSYHAGEIDYNKPISCHLYPIRVEKDTHTGFERLIYDEWDICKAACSLGKKNKITIYEFCKEALVRKYGAEFYDELDKAAEYVTNKK